MKQHSHGQMYICKPENGCQGQGIFLIDSPAKLDPTVPLVVQEYMASPLLIDGLKFDLRIYVLITSVTPLRVFLYEDGIARFATERNIVTIQPFKLRIRIIFVIVTLI
jgi:tubulin polyglutamylase TTLL6/13